MSHPMNIMLIDDQRDLTSIYSEWLKAAGHEAVIVGDLTTAQRIMNAVARPFDLIVIDLLLKRFEPTFKSEHDIVSQAMTQARLGNIPTGQALGLRIWQSAKRTPYCYLSAHTPFWMQRLGSPPEFDGKSRDEVAQLLLDKDRVRLAELVSALSDVVVLWKNNQWL